MMKNFLLFLIRMSHLGRICSMLRITYERLPMGVRLYPAGNGWLIDFDSRIWIWVRKKERRETMLWSLLGRLFSKVIFICKIGICSRQTKKCCEFHLKWVQTCLVESYWIQQAPASLWPNFRRLLVSFFLFLFLSVLPSSQTHSAVSKVSVRGWLKWMNEDVCACQDVLFYRSLPNKFVCAALLGPRLFCAMNGLTPTCRQSNHEEMLWLIIGLMKWEAGREAEMRSFFVNLTW